MAEIKRVVHIRVPKTDDIEIHVSTLITQSGSYCDIREFVVSLDQYGRGITFPARLTESIQRGLEGVPDEVQAAVEEAVG